MNEGIQIYKCDNMTIYQRYFYDMTRLNFMYDRRRLNILFPLDGVYNTYIIQLDYKKDINIFRRYIYGILLDEKESQISFEKHSFDSVDLKCVQKLIEQFGLVVLKVPLFANYNMMLYSKQEEMIDKINKNILELKSDKFDIENIEDFMDPKNFLLI